MTSSSETPGSVVDDSPVLESETPKNRRKWLWLLMLLGLLAGGGLIWYFFLRDTSDSAPPPPQLVNVTLQEIETGQFENSSNYVGNLTAEQKVTLRAETAGRIVQMLSRSGQLVRAGTPIMQLRLDRSRAQLNAATANINVQRASRANAEAALRTSQARLRESQERMASAAAEVERQKAEVTLQQAEFQRTQTLVSQGAQARQALDVQRRNLNTAIAARNSAVKDYNAAQATVLANQQEIEAARANLDRENAALTQAQAQARVEGENLEDTRVLAPVAGVVGDITLKVGDYVNTGQELTTLTSNRALEVRFSVPAQKATQLRQGLPVELTVDKQASQPLARGKISFISPEANPQTQAITAKATFPNPNGVLRSDQFVRVKVIWDRTPAVLVPTVAVSRVGNQAFVFVAQNQKNAESGKMQLVAKQKPVQLGAIQGNSYRVLEGLQAGERIATTGILNLSDGTAIAPEEVGEVKEAGGAEKAQ
ncbi:MAG: efflux RND transporter periplasmic adaptor subunit [Rivularia sp. (in: Bacteria)]|nr:efflux RND transporter periplasmic adaptor subunit [Rivularia sp. MS3]